MTDSFGSSPESERRASYHRELDQLVADVLRLGALVCETIPRGTDVLLNGDLGLARRLVDDDDEIDALSLDIEERVYSIMVRQAPMASELRTLITVLKLVGELERSGDLMVNVSKAARRMYGEELTPRIRGVISAMSAEAHKLLRLSLDSFAEQDAALAEALADIDDQLDQLNRDIVEVIFEAQAEGKVGIAAAVQLALIARYYERIGDHAVNIGHRVTYMVTGWLPEHLGAMRAEARRSGSAEEADPDVDGSAGTDTVEPPTEL